jgi:predicted nucleic acid-binding Zn finger protein
MATRTAPVTPLPLSKKRRWNPGTMNEVRLLSDGVFGTGGIYGVKSYTGKDWYVVDFYFGHCTCPHFTKKGGCKHYRDMKAVEKGARLGFSRLDDLHLRYRNDLTKQALVLASVSLREQVLAKAQGRTVEDIRDTYVS